MSKSPSISSKRVWQAGINFAGQEIIGQRSVQEDYSLFRLLGGGSELLIVLADGMGGHTSGEVASKRAVTTFDSTFVEYPSDSVPTKLGAALQQANNDLGKLIESDKSLDGMGCTLIGAHIGSDGLRWISVGDSLLYLYRAGKLMHLNADHSMTPVIEESYKAGKITKEEALNHPNRNALRSAVMGGEIPLIDSPKSPLALVSGDIVIVASDGILTLSPQKICDLLKKCSNKTADEISSVLINAVDAINKPHQDNTTIQVLLIPNSVGSKRVGFFKRLSFALLLVVILGFAGYAANQLNLFGMVNKYIKDVGGSANQAPQPVALPQSTSSSASSDPTPPAPLPAQEPSEKRIESKKVTPKGESKPKQSDGRGAKSGSVPVSPAPSSGSSSGSLANAGGLESQVNGAAAPSQSAPKPTPADAGTQSPASKADSQGSI